MNTELVVGSWSDKPQNMQTSGVSDPQEWLVEAFGGVPSYAGVRVDARSILTSGPVYQAITLISDALAEMPIETFRTTGKASKETLDTSHPIYRIWNTDGNDMMLPFNVRQTLQGHMLLYGNGIGIIEWRNGRPVGVYPMPYGTVWAQRLPYTTEFEEMNLGGEIIYHYSTPNGHTGTLWKEEVFHLKAYGSGLWGMSPMHLFKNLIGNGLAMEKFQGMNFGNSARPSGLLEKQYGDGIPTKLTPEARANLRREWNDLHTGLDNTGKVAILTDGLKWVPMSVNAEQAEMIDSLKFYREQVAAIYKIPPHKLGAMENSSVRANIEEQNRAWVQETLRPHATVWEQECMWKLTSQRERARGNIKVQMNFRDLLRADLKTRYDSYAVGRQWGWLSVNDIRSLEKLDEIGDAGDEYLRPMNMVNVEVGQQLDEQQLEQNQASASNTEATDLTENLLAYARQSLLHKQSIELNNLRRGLNRKKPFNEVAEDYYSTFPDMLLESLQPLSTVSGFVGPTELNGLVNEYVSESFELVRDVRNEKQLLEAFVRFPPRIDSFLDRIRTG